MAFGIKRMDLIKWKRKVIAGEIAFLTHYWHDQRFPHYHTVTKVGCKHLPTLIKWGDKYNLEEKWIHHGMYPHYDLMGIKQYEILKNEGLIQHIKQFNLEHHTRL